MPELLTIKDTALKLNLSYDTVRRMIADERLKTVAIGKRKKISIEQIENMTTGRDKEIIMLISKLAYAGYSVEQIEQIVDIVRETV